LSCGAVGYECVEVGWKVNGLVLWTYSLPERKKILDITLKFHMFV
jgi:hypothetical protein